MTLLSTERESTPPRAAPNAIPTPAQPAVEAPGKIGRYLVINRIGQGGMGVVYSAYDPELDRRIALKLLPTASHCPNSAARLLGEARSMARLAHPNVVSVHDAGTIGAEVYIAMEYVRGYNLRQWLQAAERPWRERVQRFIEAGRGLASAHALGIVHRDFKPDNVLVRDDGRVQVADFGLAKQAPPDDSGSASLPELDVDVGAATVRGPGGESSQGLTAVGQFMGTPAYMSPEQIGGRDVGPRSDQFSFCVALYEALYRVRPFPGESASELFDAIRAGHVRPPPRGGPIPHRIFRILRRGLAIEPAQRYPAMSDLLLDLARDPGRRLAQFVSGLVATVAVSALLGLLWTSRRAAALEADRAERAAESSRESERKAADADRRALYRGRATLASVLVERHPAVAGALLWTIPAASRDDAWRQAALDVVHANLPWWTITQHPELADSIVMLTGSDAFISASDGVIFRHDLASRTSTPISDERTVVATNVAVAPDERWLAGAWPHGEVRIWSLEAPTAPHRSVFGHDEDITSLAFSPGGGGLLGGFADGRAALWDLRVDARIDLDAGDASPVIYAASVGPNAWLTVTRDGCLTSWSADGARLARRQIPVRLWDAVIAPDRRTMATGADDGMVCIWDATNLAERRCFAGHTKSIDTVRFSSRGEWLVSASEDGTARVWDLSPDERHVTLTGHVGPVNNAVFMSGDAEVVTASEDRTVRRWRRDGSGVSVRYRGHNERVAGVLQRREATTL